MHTSPKISIFSLNTCCDAVSSAQSALCVESVRGPVGVGEGEHLLLKGMDLTKSKQLCPRLSRKEKEQICGSVRGRLRREKQHLGESRGSRLPQAPEHPTTGLCMAGCKLQAKGSNAKQLLIFIMLLLLFVCQL